MKNALRSRRQSTALLEEYRRKRDPARTPEPFGSKRKRGSAPRFVIQRHDARRLHYDFRLERHGALASWAVPKGVPLRRGERHLAVHVEDHPLEYGDFEGTIPAGEYGAGTVEIWDRGTYELLEEKKNGGLTVRLHGERLDGVWTLVPAHLDGDPKNWLLLRKDADDGAGLRYAPMSATTTGTLPKGEDWVYEPKWDGYRALVTVTGGETRFTSRRGNDLTQRFAECARKVAAEPALRGCRPRRGDLRARRAGPVAVLAPPGRAPARSPSSCSTCSRSTASRWSTFRSRSGGSGSRRSSSPARGSVLVSPQFDDGEALLAGRAGAGPRGGRREAEGLAVPAGAPRHGVAQGQGAAGARARDRRLHERPGPALVWLRRARGRRQRGGRAPLGGERRHGLLRRGDRPAPQDHEAAPARRLAARGDAEDAARTARRRRLARAGARRAGRVRRVDARGPSARAGLHGPAGGQDCFGRASRADTAAHRR